MYSAVYVLPKQDTGSITPGIAILGMSSQSATSAGSVHAAIVLAAGSATVGVLSSAPSKTTTA